MFWITAARLENKAEMLYGIFYGLMIRFEVVLQSHIQIVQQKHRQEKPPQIPLLLLKVIIPFVLIDSLLILYYRQAIL